MTAAAHSFHDELDVDLALGAGGNGYATGHQRQGEGGLHTPQGEELVGGLGGGWAGRGLLDVGERDTGDAAQICRNGAGSAP